MDDFIAWLKQYHCYFYVGMPHCHALFEATIWTYVHKWNKDGSYTMLPLPRSWHADGETMEIAINKAWDLAKKNI